MADDLIQAKSRVELVVEVAPVDSTYTVEPATSESSVEHPRTLVVRSEAKAFDAFCFEVVRNLPHHVRAALAKVLDFLWHKAAVNPRMAQKECIVQDIEPAELAPSFLTNHVGNFHGLPLLIPRAMEDFVRESIVNVMIPPKVNSVRLANRAVQPIGSFTDHMRRVVEIIKVVAQEDDLIGSYRCDNLFRKRPFVMHVGNNQCDLIVHRGNNITISPVNQGLLLRNKGGFFSEILLLRPNFRLL